MTKHMWPLKALKGGKSAVTLFEIRYVLLTSEGEAGVSLPGLRCKWLTNRGALQVGERLPRVPRKPARVGGAVTEGLCRALPLAPTQAR